MSDRGDDGRFTQEFSDEEFLIAIESVGVASTSNIADEVGCSYDLAYRRLKQLEDEGTIKSEQVGPSFVWVAE